MGKNKFVAKECKHEFIHATASCPWGCIIKVYCKHCGVDTDDIQPPIKKLLKHLR